MPSWFCIEITFTHPLDRGTYIYKLINRTTDQVKRFRSEVWNEGFFLPDKTGNSYEGYLIGPRMILYVYLVRQARKFPDDDDALFSPHADNDKPFKPIQR